MANTTNLNLAKPAGTDKALVSVLNSNSDKIDAWAGSTNQAIKPTGHQSSDISYSGTYGSYISGGYFMIGNLVVLNIIVSATESRASTTKMFELPSSAKPRHTIALTAVNSVDDLPPQYSIITNTGGVFIKDIVAGKSYTISGCWLKS